MTKVFRSNRSQAVRLPKAAEFPEGTDVEVVVYGNVRVLVPKIATWDDWLKNGPRLSEDFPADIEDLPPEPVEWP